MSQTKPHLSENLYLDAGFVLREGEPSGQERADLGALFATNLRKTRSFDDPARFLLADTLEKCSRRHRCRLAACPQCAHAFQRWAHEQALEVLAPLGPVATLTYIPAGLQRSPGALAKLRMDTAARHVRRKFHEAGISDLHAVGFFDISLNIHAEGEWDPVFQPHAAFLMPAQEVHRVSAALRTLAKTQRSSPWVQQQVKRPIRQDAVIDQAYQGSYVFKWRPVKNTWFEAWSPHANPTEQWLQPKQQVEVLLWLGDHPPQARMINCGIGRCGQSLKWL